MNIQMDKSSRHSKITGDFGEMLVVYWLSKHGIEAGRFDHTGIDIVAANPYTSKTMGISVKSRSRSPGTESEALLIKRKDLRKAEASCAPFNWEPYFALVVDAGPLMRCFLLSAEYLEEMFPTHVVTLNWKMDSTNLLSYYDDPNIVVFEMQTRTVRWLGGENQG